MNDDDHREISEAFEVHERATLPVRRGQKWFSYVAGAAATLSIIATVVRHALGLFDAGEYDTLPTGQVWQGFALGLGFALASAAFAQVAVGPIGRKLLEKITPGGGTA